MCVCVCVCVRVLLLRFSAFAFSFIFVFPYFRPSFFGLIHVSDVCTIFKKTFASLLLV